MSEVMYSKEFQGIAKIEKVMANLAKSLAEVKVNPQDLTNPVSFQIMFSKIYEAVLKSLEEGGKTTYIAEVKFKDSLGNVVTLALDLGENPPPFTNKVVKARVIVELLEE